jgi:serine phosphatase RsbU (regulator of sigma subunit)
MYCNQGLQLANEIGAKGETLDCYVLLAKIYKSESNYKKALEYSELLFSLNDSIYNAEKAKQIQELETQYETKKKEQQIINLENEKEIRELKIKKQRHFTIFLLSGFISIFIFLLVLFRQNKRIRKANKLLAYQKRQITDSIEYASRIQTAILPPGDYISRVIPDHFILYKPRDIVSGDFYWITHKDGKIVVAVVDCTGHGVPGAFMSMLGFAFLNEIVNKEPDLKASNILNELRDYVKESLHQTGKENEAKDGMDIALCVIDPEHNKLQYAGAYNPLYLIRNEEFISLKADRMPIGIHIVEKESFTNHEMDIQKGDIIYIFTDGYIDQFGGPNAGKFKAGPFKDKLVSIKDKSMKEQKEILENEFYNWKGERDQIDDVLVMGIKI